jgi:uncharacterized protein
MSLFLTIRKRYVLSQSSLYSALVVIMLLLASTLPASAQNGYPTRIDPYINDYAQVISAEDAGNIRQVLSDLKSRKGVELVVVTVNSIGDYQMGDTTIESFATHLFNTWGIGDAQRNDGVMLLVAIKDRKLRIELGRGYGSGHSPEMQSIIDNTIVPDFKQSAYSRGIYRGVKAIADQITGGKQAGPVGASARPSSATTSSRQPRSAAADGPTVMLVLGLIAGIAAVAIGANILEPHIPRQCPNCHTRMTRVEQTAGSSYLNPGQQQEQQLGSAVYVVWKCPACEAVKSEPHYKRSGFSMCPGCDCRTLDVSDIVKVQPTESAAGLREVSQTCRYCDYRYLDSIILPMIVASSGDGGGSDWGGGSDFAGDGSDGGGASGSW